MTARKSWLENYQVFDAPVHSTRESPVILTSLRLCGSHQQYMVGEVDWNNLMLLAKFLLGVEYEDGLLSRQ